MPESSDFQFAAKALDPGFRRDDGWLHSSPISFQALKTAQSYL